MRETFKIKFTKKKKLFYLFIYLVVKPKSRHIFEIIYLLITIHLQIIF